MKVASIPYIPGRRSPVHLEMLKWGLEEKGVVEGESSIFLCNLCTFSASQRNTLDAHMLSNHHEYLLGCSQGMASMQSIPEGLESRISTPIALRSVASIPSTPHSETSEGVLSKSQMDSWVNQILKAGPFAWIQAYNKKKRRNQLLRSRSATVSPLMFLRSDRPHLTRRASFSSMRQIRPCSTSAFSSAKRS